MSYSSLVGCRFWLDFQRFYKFFIDSFHLPEVFLRYVRRLWKNRCATCSINLKTAFQTFSSCLLHQLLFAVIAAVVVFVTSSPYLARAPLYILRFSLCIFYEHRRKDEHFKPSIFETAPIIASIEPERSMSACAMNTFKPFFFLQDKVANIWCSISVLIKVKRVLTQTQIIKLRLVIAFYARERWMLCQSALWEFIGTLLSLNATFTFPIMHFIYSPKFCISIVFSFS